MRRWTVSIATCGILMLAACVPALAGTYHLDVGDSAILKYQGIRRLSVGNPEVLDCRPLNSREMLVTGKSPGGATIVVWDRSGRHFERLRIHPSNDAAAWELEQALENDDIRVTMRGEGVVLEGTVNDPRERRRAEAVASVFRGKVVNLLEVRSAPQIQLRASVMEIAKGALKQMGLRALAGSGSEMIGPWNDEKKVYEPGAQLTFSPANGHYLFWDSARDVAKSLALQIDALVEDDKAKILSEPYLVTLSGQEASLNVGGEIPVPVGVKDSQIKIEWKPYGILLRITPELDGEGKIWLSMDAEVSEIDWDNAIDANNLRIPALRTRKISNRVHLLPGQSLVVGGLLDNKQVKLFSKIPLLGDLPIIGELFRSKKYQKSETELVITVVPEVVRLQ